MSNGPMAMIIDAYSNGRSSPLKRKGNNSQNSLEREILNGTAISMFLAFHSRIQVFKSAIAFSLNLNNHSN